MRGRWPLFLLQQHDHCTLRTVFAGRSPIEHSPSFFFSPCIFCFCDRVVTLGMFGTTNHSFFFRITVNFTYTHADCRAKNQLMPTDMRSTAIRLCLRVHDKICLSRLAQDMHTLLQRLFHSVLFKHSFFHRLRSSTCPCVVWSPGQRLSCRCLLRCSWCSTVHLRSNHLSVHHRNFFRICNILAPSLSVLMIIGTFSCPPSVRTQEACYLSSLRAGRCRFLRRSDTSPSGSCRVSAPTQHYAFTSNTVRCEPSTRAVGKIHRRREAGVTCGHTRKMRDGEKARNHHQSTTHNQHGRTREASGEDVYLFCPVTSEPSPRLHLVSPPARDVRWCGGFGERRQDDDAIGGLRSPTKAVVQSLHLRQLVTHIC